MSEKRENPTTFLGRVQSWLNVAYNLMGFGKKQQEAARKPRENAAEKRPEIPIQPPLDLLEFREKLWGEGFLLPGGPEFSVFLAKPFNLNSAMSMIDMTCSNPLVAAS